MNLANTQSWELSRVCYHVEQHNMPIGQRFRFVSAVGRACWNGVRV